MRDNDFENDLLNKKQVDKVDAHHRVPLSEVKRALKERGLTLQQITGVKGIILDE